MTLTDESIADAAIWEPWVPVVGQRVRYVHSAECQQHSTRALEADGAAGTVTRVVVESPPSIPSGHRFLVTGDDPRYQGWAAAIELEPLAPSPDRGAEVAG